LVRDNLTQTVQCITNEQGKKEVNCIFQFNGIKYTINFHTFYDDEYTEKEAKKLIAKYTKLLNEHKKPLGVFLSDPEDEERTTDNILYYRLE